YPCQRLTPQSSEKKTAHSSYSSTPTTNPNPAAAATHQKQDQSPTNHGQHHQTRPHTYTGTRSSTQIGRASCRERVKNTEDGIRDRNVTGVQTCALPIFYPCQRLTPQSSEKKTAHSSYSSTPTTNPNPAAAATHQKQDQSPTNHGHHHQTRPHTYTGTRSSTQSIYCR